MNKFTTGLLLATAFMGLTSCHKIIGNGPVVAEMRNTREFSAVHFAIPGEMYFIPSDKPEITIEAQRNIIDAIETYVSDNELKVRMRNNANIHSSEEIRVTVKGAGVNRLSLSGSGNLKVSDNFASSSANLTVSGSGYIIVDKLEAEDLDAVISGSGRIEVRGGTVGHEHITISGSGNVDMLSVQAGKANTRTSGSGTIRLAVSEELEARISGSGDVLYKGSPVVNTTISGSGRVVRLD